jgi:hypothetical protein
MDCCRQFFGDFSRQATLRIKQSTPLLGFERGVERYRKEHPYQRSVYDMDGHKKHCDRPRERRWKALMRDNNRQRILLQK